MSDLTLSQTIVEMDKLARFAKSIEGAKDVIGALQSAEQVGRELAIKKDALTKEVAELDALLEAGKTELSDARGVAKKTLNDASIKAEKIIAEARAQASTVLADASQKVAAAGAKLAEMQAAGVEAQRLRDTAKRELSDIETRISKAKDAARAMLG